MTPFRQTCFAVALVLFSACPLAIAAGGPDAFGYTWISSSDPGGPAVEWIDISTVGTPVTGLADDNAAAPITLPKLFRYYWNDVSQVTVGSNGWIGMQPASNIASCFPTIPTTGGAADSYLAPMMSDLIFTGAGNPASALTYYDSAMNRFVISFLSVPYWQVNAPGYIGSNSFQVVLDYTDRSIRFNYLNTSAFLPNAACVDFIVGIESPSGTMGLQPFNEVLPPTPGTLRFDYPDPPLIDVIDPAPESLMNSDSAAVFVHADVPLTLNAVVENSGTTETTGPVNVQAEVRQTNTGGVSLYDQSQVIPSLNMNEQVAVNFVPDYLPVQGPQVLLVTTSGGGDINAGNNQVVSEIRGLVEGGLNQTLGYVNASVSDGSVNWNGATGMFDYGVAVLIIPPDGGYSINNLQAFVTSASSGETMVLELRDNDGSNGLPGTSLGLIESSSVVAGAWNTYALPRPVAVDADGFYLVWYQRSQTLFIGTVSNEPVSRRGLELLGGSFSRYRNNETTDLMLRVNANSADLLFIDGFD